jgi:tetratricopeptide (TPR) repeat protein
MAYGLATYAWTLSHLGKGTEAVQKAERALQLSSGGQFYVAVLGSAYAAAGRTSDARAALQRLDEMSVTGYVSPYHRALIHVALGERKRALELLAEARSINESWLAWLAVEPQLDPLRAEPAFSAILNSTRNPAVVGVAQKARASAAARPLYSSEPTSVTSPVPSPAPQTLDSANEEARQLYTAGRYYATRRTAEGMRQAIERLKRAVELDPEFALAYAEMADCYSLLNWYVEPPPAGAWELAKQAALKAVEADPELAEGPRLTGICQTSSRPRLGRCRA